MLFNSFSFILFLLIVFTLYYAPLFKSHQVSILILASLFFYAWEYPLYVFLLLVSAAINIIVSFSVAHALKSNNKRRLAVIGVLINIFILSFFKYNSLFSASLLDPASSIGSFLLFIPLPIGISFFTFEGISLVVDVFREKNEVQSIVPKSIVSHSKNVLLFITFFPHLIAGPILKAHDFVPQISTKKYKDIQWASCYKYLVLGYFLKMVIADNLSSQTFWITPPYFLGHSSLTLLVMLIGYSAQIFADFAGYSLIALGLATLFGYRLEQNFNFPYISKSFSEFWRRWHISLSSFLKEYLYIPMGGNRRGEIRTYINLMITMLLGGLWHGAAWSYAVWGGFHGTALALERLLGKYIKLPNWKIVKLFQIVVVFSFVTLAWLLFKLPNFTDVLNYIEAFFNNTNKYNDFNLITYTLLYSLPVFLFHLMYLLKSTKLYYFLFKKIEYAWYGLLLFFIITNSGSPNGFIYFQF
jgi:alginate O-acetyltransferase complex protein AlgI